MRLSTLCFVAALALVGCTDKDQDTSLDPDTSAVEFVGISTDATSLNVVVGGTQQLVILADYDDGSTQDITSATSFRVVNASVASVSETGLLTGLGLGTTKVEVTYQGELIELTVRVGAPSIAGRVTVLGLPLVGATVQLSGDDTATRVSDSSGRFSFTNLAVGDYTVSAVLEGSERSGPSTASLSLSADVSDVELPITAAGYAIAPDSWESDNLPGTATRLDIGTAQHHTLFRSPAGIVDGGDADYFRVSLIANATYDFFTAGLTGTGDTYLTLYAADGVTELDDDTVGLNLDAADDFVGFESRIVYTPTQATDVVFAVREYSAEYGVTDYFVGAVVTVDADRDGVPNYRDCADNDAARSPLEREVPGDGIDNNCSGADQPAIDPNEPNNDRASATPAPRTIASIWERTLDMSPGPISGIIGSSDDVDMFSIVVPPRTLMYVDSQTHSGSVSLQTLATDGLTAQDLDNTGTVNETRYVRVTGSEGAAYSLAIYSAGVDADNDGDYPHAFNEDRDCAEGDPSRGASECADD